MPWFPWTINREYELLDGQDYQDLYTDQREGTYFRLHGYKKNSYKSIIFHILSVLLLGVPYVFIAWFPQLKCTKFKSVSLDHATVLLVKDNEGKKALLDVHCKAIDLPELEGGLLRYFVYEHSKYVWISSEKRFGTLDELIKLKCLNEYLDDRQGLVDINYIELLKLYGPNTIEVEVKSYWRLLVEEVFNPFYVFQAFSMLLWCMDDYMIYAGCVFVLTLFSAVSSLIQTRKQSEALHHLVESSKCSQVQVKRQGLNEIADPDFICNVDPKELVPGDLIVLPRGHFVMPCDAVLITGQCIVNESVLTGESVPVTKTPPHHGKEIYKSDLHKRNTLFAGTSIIQTRYYGGEQVLARVVRTGFDTTKGLLVKSILFPTPVGLKFYKDSLKFVFVLFFIAAMGMSYCMYLYIIRRAHFKDILIRTLDIVTIVVPPALPAAMTVGTVYSQNRLKKLGIFCISPARINVCGKLKLACFDKTGTLTHDCLTMHSVISCTSARFSEPSVSVSEFDSKNKFVQGMATCHSITRIDGTLNGDPLDLNMFEFVKWNLEEPGDDESTRYDMLGPSVVSPKKYYTLDKDSPSDEIGILRQFPFSSTLQCMSVICRNLGSPHMIVYTKGAPEKIVDMCVPASLPYDYSMRLSQYTSKGYRVIAMAYKDLPSNFNWRKAQRVKRDVIECDLIFLGYIIMQNPLKPETAPVIQTLHKANIRTTMITGDNIFTAVSVAFDCGMVRSHEKILMLKTVSSEANSIPSITFEDTLSSSDPHIVYSPVIPDDYHLALDGRTWEILKTYYADLIPYVIVRTVIFARFQPDQKAQVIKELQKVDYVVSMVGDGANDCGALKAAHVGISLSQAEASVAAPFTSSLQNISCLIHLMLEGRCALVTSFAVFKYMALYSLIQFITILLLYKHHSILGDFEFLFIDLIITTSLAVTIAKQGPSDKLQRKRPMASLVCANNLVPMMLQIVTCAGIQVGSLFYLSKQEWYKPITTIVYSDSEIIQCWENTVLFTVSCFQYLILAVVYSKGQPHRESLIRNFWFLVSSVLLTVFITCLMVFPTKYLSEMFELMYLPNRAKKQDIFRYTLVAFPLAHLLIAIFIEYGIAETQWLKCIIHFITRKKNFKNKYKHMMSQNDFSRWFDSQSGSFYNESHIFV